MRGCASRAERRPHDHPRRGEHGLALAADADAILRALDASVADISDPEPAT